MSWLARFWRRPPRFTVLLPVHRPPALLPFAIESVLAQRSRDFELFVICDGAPAETVACAREYARRDRRVRVFAFAKGERHGEAYRHAALQEARGRYVAHICDDDFWFPAHLDEMEKLLAVIDFGNLRHTQVDPRGEVRSLPGNLAAPEIRRAMLHEKFNFFSPTFAGYRLDAYRRLPEGWTPAPPDVWTDLYMWRKFLRRDDMSFATGDAITALHFPASARAHMALDQRAAENKAWFERARDPSQREMIIGEALRSLSAPEQS